MAQSTLFVFEARDKNLGALIEEKREQLRRLRAEFRKTEEGTEQYAKLAGQVATTKDEVSQLTAEQRKLNKEFKAMSAPTDSLIGLRLEYSKLNDQVIRLSEAERKSDFGRRLITQTNNLKGEIDSIEQSLGRFHGNVGNYTSAFDKIAPAIQKAGFVFSGLFAALQGGNAIVTATRETEKFFAVLKNSVGSEDAALRIFKQIQTFAAETPFALNEVVGAFNKLEQRNFNPTIEQLRTMGDIASSSGKTIDQFVEAILDAQTGEFERLKEFGIVARKNGDELKVSFRGQTQTIANTGDAITDYLLALGQLPGISGAATAVSKTLDGSISNLGDNMTRLFATIGSGGGLLKGMVDGFNFILDSVNNYLDVPLSESLEEERREFNALATAVTAAGEKTEIRTSLIKQMQAEYPGFLQNLDAETVTNEQLAEAIALANLQFQKKIVLAANEERLAEAAKKVAEVYDTQTDAILRQSRAIDESEERRRIRERQAGQSRPVEGLTRGFTTSDRTAQEAANIERLGSLINETQNKIQSAADEQARLQRQLSDTFVQLFGQTEEQARAELGLTKTREKGNAATSKSNSETEALAGSILFLKQQISALQKEIDNTPGDSQFLVPLIQRLNQANDLLELAEKNLLQASFRAISGRELTAPDIAIEDAPPIELIPELKVDDKTEADAKKKAKELKDRVEADLQAIEFPIEIKIPADQQAALDALNKEREKAEEDFYRRQEELANQAAQKELQRREQLKQAIISSANEIAGAVFQIQQNRIDREEQTAIQALENEYDRRIQLAGNNVTKRNKLEKELAEKREAIEKESAEKRKKVAKQEAIIQGALAVVEALPDLVLAAFAAAATI
ncbi:MAG: hypothetical protein KDC70_13195, partial [Saprospiraceae bacterium]|nr:hypothetical protein [Saprospiraceae bacterium]